MIHSQLGHIIHGQKRVKILGDTILLLEYWGGSYLIRKWLYNKIKNWFQGLIRSINVS